MIGNHSCGRDCGLEHSDCVGLGWGLVDWGGDDGVDGPWMGCSSCGELLSPDEVRKQSVTDTPQTSLCGPGPLVCHTASGWSKVRI